MSRGHVHRGMTVMGSSMCRCKYYQSNLRRIFTQCVEVNDTGKLSGKQWYLAVQQHHGHSLCDHSEQE